VCWTGISGPLFVAVDGTGERDCVSCSASANWKNVVRRHAYCIGERDCQSFHSAARPREMARAFAIELSYAHSDSGGSVE